MKPRALDSVSLVAIFLFAALPLQAATKGEDLAKQVREIFQAHRIDWYSQAKGRIEKKLDLTELVAVSSSKRLINDRPR